MSIPLKSASPPSKQKFAGVFRMLGRISFWAHILLGGAAGIIILLVMLSRNFSNANNSYIGFGIFLAICSILAVGFRIYWAYRYTRLARLLESSDRSVHPQKAEVIEVLRIGLYVSLAGLFIAFLATEQTVIAVLAKSLARPEGVTIYEARIGVRPIDLFLILANVNIMGAHFLGSVNSLGLLDWLDS
ncbi:DUF3611 family protein [Mastigocoleus testarum]|uniref:DUF3611 domain-containing protein n=1 Tax=Mastigocoleus testarum BC008 TaxID=371196 RepID=A0A0V7ZQQ1_9CYAN|nr:DUF3611 family protein [Mastigocoleus testarum]KST66766.1 hypothetical protein BC008_26635 [Mastigocoleus testarum BC008]